ncbi:MAG: hypothetical protein OXT69_14795 [Candidatus Poribacteria bacterium]|nr:hypothetical protein [Candidatus Poribacteria bacterium]
MKAFKRYFALALGLALAGGLAHAQTQLSGPYLWVIAPTEDGMNGSEAIVIDQLSIATDGAVTEDGVAVNGANEGDQVGDYAWTSIALPDNGDINAMLVEAGVTDNAGLDRVSSYALIDLDSPSAQENVLLSTGSDDAIKVWLNGEVVQEVAANRGRARYQESVRVSLKAGMNRVLVKVSEGVGGWGMHFGINADFTAGGVEYMRDPVLDSVPGENIAGPWLWMIALSGGLNGPQAIDIDLLAEASGGAVTEEDIANRGAREGAKVGDLEWTAGEIATEYTNTADNPNGNANALAVDLGFTENADLNNVGLYGYIVFDVGQRMETVMHVGSDDSVKVWLNGEVVWTHAVGRGASDVIDAFPVTLQAGYNRVLMKVTEGGGGWSFYAAMDEMVEFQTSTSVDPAGKATTSWGALKAQR